MDRAPSTPPQPPFGQTMFVKQHNPLLPHGMGVVKLVRNQSPTHNGSARRSSLHAGSPPSVRNTVRRAHGGLQAPNAQALSMPRDISGGQQTTTPATLAREYSGYQIGATNEDLTSTGNPALHPFSTTVGHSQTTRQDSQSGEQSTSAHGQNGSLGATPSQSATTSMSSSSAPSVVAIPKNRHTLSENYNGYGRYTAKEILYGKDDAGKPLVPEEHVYGGVVLKLRAAYTVTEIAKGVNAKKIAAGKQKATNNSYTKRCSAALLAKAQKAKAEGRADDVVQELIDADVAAGKSREVAEASRKQKYTGSKDNAYGSVKQRTAASSATATAAAAVPVVTAPAKRKRATEEAQAADPMPKRKRQARSRKAGPAQATVASTAAGPSNSEDQSISAQQPAPAAMGAGPSSNVSPQVGFLYGETEELAFAPKPSEMSTEGLGVIPLWLEDVGVALGFDPGLSRELPYIAAQQPDLLKAVYPGFFENTPLALYFDDAWLTSAEDLASGGASF